ncbi:membrane dipeptidase [Temperatibacter marinus]|uniref:Membrane dipeptidase n=1 Tax=Temperatibacter marinus TaxID=1456591 RepID=A0AA52EG58_9PROT|nr:membrane dipeptidase [Temperatibacter marinus]WND02523.1 membrane dipeptidase [Temperatibacter marinus]
MDFSSLSLKKVGKTVIATVVSILFFGVILMITFGSYIVDKDMNSVEMHEPYYITAKAQSLHNNLIVMDWHSDALMWDRSLLTRQSYGHVDVPRLMEGNIAIQMFTTVTKSPSGMNYNHNDTDAFDLNTPLFMAQLWPPKTWTSLLERALYQAKKLEQFTNNSDGQLVFVKDRLGLARVIEARTSGRSTIAALLGSEGAHPLEGKLKNIDIMYDAGFRMMGLVHFFDNELGGSLHGMQKGGLTPFGHKAVQKMIEKGIIIDLAHASEAMVRDVLEYRNARLVISHTGFKGACESPRNIADDLMQEIAGRGGIIAVGYWEGAICEANPIGIAKSILYGIDLVGIDHVALGSDWDGAKAALASNEMNIITQTLMSAGLSNTDIMKVMGMNSLNFLMRSLP